MATLTAEERRREARNNFSQNIDSRHGTVVCSHWLKKLCLKGGKCEFLHQLDLDRMPVCPHGLNCNVEGCELRHEDEDEKYQCVLYKQGFCPHGPNCQYRHKYLDKSNRPEVADFTPFAKKKTTATGSKVTEPPPGAKNENYKTRLCRHFQNEGHCVYGDACLYAHGTHELRAPQRKSQAAPQTAPTLLPAPPVVSEASLSARLSGSLRSGIVVAYPNLQIIRKCIESNTFGIERKYQAIATAAVKPGSSVFLLDASTDRVYGMYEATSDVRMNASPSAGAFPLQASFHAILDVRGDLVTQDEMNKALLTVDPVVGREMGTRKLSPVASSALVQLFVQKATASKTDSSVATKCSVPLGATVGESQQVARALSMTGFLQKIVQTVGNETVAKFEIVNGRTAVSIATPNVLSFVVARRMLSEEMIKQRNQQRRPQGSNMMMMMNMMGHGGFRPPFPMMGMQPGGFNPAMMGMMRGQSGFGPR